MITVRNYEKDDYNKILDYLRDILKTSKVRIAWLPQKWEYTEYNVNVLHLTRGKTKESLEVKTRIWEDNHKIVAICHNEADNCAYFEIKQGYEYLYGEMLDYAENNICEDGCVLVYDSLTYQKHELLKRGYKVIEEPTYQNIQNTEKNEYNPVLPNDIAFVDANDISDIYIRALAVHRGFHPEIDKNPYDKDIKGFESFESAPMFQRDLEVMIKHNNECIGLVIAWIDKESNTALLEPMAIWGEYQGQGLGKQLVIELLRRLKEKGVNIVYVESYNDNRKSFYNKCGFETYDKILIYKK